jgi:hypothetical protein
MGTTTGTPKVDSNEPRPVFQEAWIDLSDEHKDSLDLGTHHTTGEGVRLPSDRNWSTFNVRSFP